jgi:hypothetical protein
VLHEMLGSDVHGPARLDPAQAWRYHEPGLGPALRLGLGLAQAQAVAWKSRGSGGSGHSCRGLDVSKEVTILTRAQGHESSCNDSTRICIILLTTQVAGQILRLHHDPQSPHPLENPQ